MLSADYSLKNKTVLITGASAGIGKALAEAFAKEGATLILGARRLDRLHKQALQLQKAHRVRVVTCRLDVRSGASVKAFLSKVLREVSEVDILINNAGLALGMDTLEKGHESDWVKMWETNVLGLLRITQAILKIWKHPKNLGHTRDAKHIINLGSIAGLQAYPGGGVYCGTKHAVRALTQVLRQELLDVPSQSIRVSEIDPGMVETEFSDVRFKGNKKRAKQVYKGMQPLVAEDIARLAVFIAAQPSHVNIDQLVVTPRAQFGTTVVRQNKQ